MAMTLMPASGIRCDVVRGMHVEVCMDVFLAIHDKGNYNHNAPDAVISPSWNNWLSYARYSDISDRMNLHWI